MKICWIGMLLVAICLSSCGAPIFRTDADRFGEQPEVIQELEPYLEKWATTLPSATQEERDLIEEKMEDVVWIQVYDPRVNSDGINVYLVDIVLDYWGDWYKGYYFVYDRREIAEYDKRRIRKVSDTLYIYNRND